jgi:hypothetical protein
MPLPEIFKPSDLAELFEVSEYYVKKIARENGIGTVVARQRKFTAADVQTFLQVHEAKATKSGRASRATRATQQRTPRPKPATLPNPTDGVTVLRARPERARSYGQSG